MKPPYVVVIQESPNVIRWKFRDTCLHEYVSLISMIRWRSRSGCTIYGVYIGRLCRGGVWAGSRQEIVAD